MAEMMQVILNFASLLQLYDSNHTTNYYHSSNTKLVAESMMDYVYLSPFMLNIILTNSIDDRGWFILTYLTAYDVIGEKKYYEAAKSLFDIIWLNAYDTKVCNGGMWW